MSLSLSHNFQQFSKLKDAFTMFLGAAKSSPHPAPRTLAGSPRGKQLGGHFRYPREMVSTPHPSLVFLRIT